MRPDERHADGHRGPTAHARHTLREGERRFCSLSWARSLGGPAHLRGGAGAHRADVPLLARVAGRRHLSRPSLARVPAAFRAGAQGPDLRADRGDDRGADDLAAGDAGRRAQLGLPLLLDARRNVHAVGPARARPRLGGERLHGVPRRPAAQQGRLAPDHVRHRRRAEPARDRRCATSRATTGSRPVRKGNGAYRQRQNDVYGAVLDSVYLHTKRHDHIHDRLWPVLCDQVDGRLARVAQARPGDLGGARRAAALRLLEADVLGRARPRRAPRRAARRARARRALAGGRRRDPRRHPRPRRRRARRLRPALRHDRARRLEPARPDRPLPARPTTSACARRCSRSPTSSTTTA